MIGTFGGALEARKIDASNGRLHAKVRGEIESEQGALVIRRVHVHYLLEAVEQVRETVERVHRVYADKCPVYKTLRPAFEITSDFELTEAPATESAGLLSSGALVPLFEPDAELYDDGNPRSLKEFTRDALGHERFTSMDHVEINRLVLPGSFHSDQWGDFLTYSVSDLFRG
jgi:OsmC-like protein